MHDTDEESYPEFCALSDKEKRKLMAFCASRSIIGRSYNPDDGQVIDLVLEKSGAKITKHWRPDFDNFFNRINMATCLDAGKQIRKDDNFDDLYKKRPKREVAIMLSDEVENQSVDDCWLPEGM